MKNIVQLCSDRFRSIYADFGIEVIRDFTKWVLASIGMFALAFLLSGLGQVNFTPSAFLKLNWFRVAGIDTIIHPGTIWAIQDKTFVKLSEGKIRMMVQYYRWENSTDINLFGGTLSSEPEGLYVRFFSGRPSSAQVGCKKYTFFQFGDFERLDPEKDEIFVKMMYEVSSVPDCSATG